MMPSQIFPGKRPQTVWRGAKGYETSGGDGDGDGDDDDDEEDTQMRAHRGRHIGTHEGRHSRARRCKHTYENTHIKAHT